MYKERQGDRKAYAPACFGNTAELYDGRELSERKVDRKVMSSKMK
jgi:hypothetical protein